MVIHHIKGFIDGQKQKREERKRQQEMQHQYHETEEIKHAEDLKREADRLASLKQYKPSIEEYKKCLEVYPYNGKEEELFTNAKIFLFKVYYNIAACYTYLDQFDEAIKQFDKALNIEIDDPPNQVKALMAKGSSYYRKKLYVEGRLKHGNYQIEIETETKKDKKDKTDYVKLAHECFQQAANLDEANTAAWYNKGHMEYLMGQIKDAVNSFDHVLQLNKKYENKENVPLFNEIKKEKGLVIKESDLMNSEMQHTFKTKTGHLVKTKVERSIADFFFVNKLIFCYDCTVSWADKDDFRPMFYIPAHDLYVDHFPFDTIKEYKKSMKDKIKQYEKKKKHHIYTASEDEKNIEEALKIKLKPYVML